MLILRDREKTSKLRKYQNAMSPSLTPLSEQVYFPEVS